MLNKLKLKSEFSKNVLTLMTGTTIAQAISIAISPILTRLYTPEDFGIFALFVAITSIFGSIANGRYELAIMLPKKNEDAINIFALGLIINVVISILLFFVILTFHDNIVSFFNNNKISFWLYFVPFSVFLIGCFNLLKYFNNRLKNYKDLARTDVIKSIVNAIVQFTLGLSKIGYIGLISGQIISQLISNTKLFYNIKQLDLFRQVKKVKILVLSRKYKDFPKYSMWAILFNNFSHYSINLFIPFLYNLEILGFYSIGQRVLNIPFSVIGSSIGQVYFQEAVKEKNLTNKSIKSFMGILKKLTMVALLIFLPLYFVIENIFLFFFGEKWLIAGTYVKILILFFAIKFVVSPLTITPLIFKKNSVDFYFQIGMMVSFFVIYIITYYKHLIFVDFLCLFNIVFSIYYVFYLIILYFIALGKL